MKNKPRYQFIIIFLTIMALPYPLLYGQSVTPRRSLEFFAESRELSVIFPDKPKTEEPSTANGNIRSAQLSSPHIVLTANIRSLNDIEAAAAARLSEKDILLKAVNSKSFGESSVESIKTGTSSYGKFVRMRGKKVFDGVGTTFELVVIYGKREIMTLSVGTDLPVFPDQIAADFFDSVKTSIKSVSPKPLEISVDGGQINLKGEAIKLPIERDKLFQIIGQPNRTTKLMNTIYTWDEYGLIAYERVGETIVYQLSVIVSNVDMNYAFWSQQPFSGAFRIDGSEITKDSTLGTINKNKTGIAFAKIPSLPYIAELHSGNLIINISRALSYQYSEAGKIVEVSLSAKTAR